MKKTAVIILLGLILTSAISYVLLQNPKEGNIPTPQNKETQNQDKTTPTRTPTDESNPNLTTQPQPSPESTNQAIPTGGEYIEYNETLLQQKLAEGKKVVLFFHAAWCPTCRSADKNIQKSKNEIPSDVVILKVDYEREKELKSAYGVSYQHTFVQLAKDKSPVTKFQGGRTVPSIVANLR